MLAVWKSFVQRWTVCGAKPKLPTRTATAGEQAAGSQAKRLARVPDLFHSQSFGIGRQLSQHADERRRKILQQVVRGNRASGGIGVRANVSLYPLHWENTTPPPNCKKPPEGPCIDDALTGFMTAACGSAPNAMSLCATGNICKSVANISKL